MSQVEPADVLEALSWGLYFLPFYRESTKTKTSMLNIGLCLLKYAVIRDIDTILLTVASEFPVLFRVRQGYLLQCFGNHCNIFFLVSESDTILNFR